MSPSGTSCRVRSFPRLLCTSCQLSLGSDWKPGLWAVRWFGPSMIVVPMEAGSLPTGPFGSFTADVSTLWRANSNRPSLFVSVAKRLSGEETNAREIGSCVTLLITTPWTVSASSEGDCANAPITHATASTVTARWEMVRGEIVDRSDFNGTAPGKDYSQSGPSKNTIPAPRGASLATKWEP